MEQQKIVGVLTLDKIGGSTTTINTKQLRIKADGIIYCFSYQGYAWIFDGDIITITGTITSRKTDEKATATIKDVVLSSKPLIINGFSQSIIIRMMKKYFSLSGSTSLYDSIIRQFYNKDNPEMEAYEFIAENALKSVRGYGVIDDPFLVTRDIAREKFFNNFYRRHILRRLYNLELSPEALEDLPIDVNEIYEQCSINPYTLYTINLDLMADISQRFDLNISSSDIQCGKFTTELYKRLSESSSTYIQLDTARAMFKDFDTLLPKLIAHYFICTSDVQRLGKIVTLKKIFLDNENVCEWFTEIVNRKSTVDPILIDYLDDIDGAIKNEILEMNDDQRNAVNLGLSSEISIITGGAGTGKTQMIAEIVNILVEHDKSFHISSFTGKAAARIRDLVVPFISGKLKNIHEHITTIHQLIFVYAHLDFEYLILDESSMISTSLFSQLISAVNSIKKTKIIFIGDPNQLRPIGWGCFFEQLISADMVKYTTLNTNYRFAGASAHLGITVNQVIGDHNISFSTDPGIQQSVEVYDFKNEVKEFIDTLQSDGFIHPKNFRVICPFKKDANELNIYIHEILSRNVTSRKLGNNIYFLGQMVVMTLNDYDNNIMNGDEGEVVGIFSTHIDVKFEQCGKPRIISFYDTKRRKLLFSSIVLQDPEYQSQPSIYELDDAYASTVHRAQGSEWNIVMVFIPHVSRRNDFFCRELIYTALTRAKKKLFITGTVSWMERELNKIGSYVSSDFLTDFFHGGVKYLE